MQNKVNEPFTAQKEGKQELKPLIEYDEWLRLSFVVEA